MTKLYTLLQSLKNDETAQDMVEYALLAGFIAVAAGATLPPVANSLSIIFSKMASVTSIAATK
jgi:Flp pilus assembly pilin Flp